MTEFEGLHASAREYRQLRMRIDEAKIRCMKGEASCFAKDPSRSKIFHDRLEQFEEELADREECTENYLMILKPKTAIEARIHLAIVQAMVEDKDGGRYTRFQRETLAPRMLAEATAVLACEAGVSSVKRFQLVEEFKMTTPLQTLAAEAWKDIMRADEIFVGLDRPNGQPQSQVDIAA